MKKGQYRFEFYLNQLNVLLIKAAQQKNPGLWLYQNNARTPLFMLEGLSKMYAALHNKKKFSKLKEHFKLLEDVLGAIDYYDSIAKDISNNKKISATIIGYLNAQSREKIQSLNEMLVEEKWIKEGKSKIEKIRKKLMEANWLDESEEIKGIENFYSDEIAKIVAFTQSTDYHFDNMEADVHELRRKLRWLSIYPQALQGCIQLAKSKAQPAASLKKYLTKEITTSAFNKMPLPTGCNFWLLLDTNIFYALSWMIATLGKLKDEGLKIIALKEALQQTSKSSEAAIIKEVYGLLGKKQTSLEKLLTEAEGISKKFFAEKNLDKLVAGVSKKD